MFGKKIMIVTTLFVVIQLLIMPLINSQKIDSINLEKELHLQTYSSSYEYGFNNGKNHRQLYRLIDIIVNFIDKKGLKEEELSNIIELIETYCPMFLDELKGLSDSTNIKLERLISLQHSLYTIFGNKCTTTLSTGNATKNNETFLTQNWDVNAKGSLFYILLLRLLSYKINIVRIKTMNYSYAYIGFPIIYELPLFNEMGLGWGGNGITMTQNQSRHIDNGTGTPIYLLHRYSVMKCKNVSEVAEFWKNAERASGISNKWPNSEWDNDASVYCDKEGGILAIEQTHNHIATVFGNQTDITNSPEGILWHTNHHLWLDANLTGSIYPGEENVVSSSFLRANRARELLVENYGNITLDVCKNITRDHDGGLKEGRRDSYDICAHPDKNGLDTTMISWIIDPKNYTIYLSHRNPCLSRFVKHDLKYNFR